MKFATIIIILFLLPVQIISETRNENIMNIESPLFFIGVLDSANLPIGSGIIKRGPCFLNLGFDIGMAFPIKQENLISFAIGFQNLILPISEFYEGTPLLILQQSILISETGKDMHIQSYYLKFIWQRALFSFFNYGLIFKNSIGVINSLNTAINSYVFQTGLLTSPSVPGYTHTFELGAMGGWVFNSRFCINNEIGVRAYIFEDGLLYDLFFELNLALYLF